MLRLIEKCKRIKEETKKRGQRDLFNLVKVWHTIILNGDEIKNIKGRQ